MLRLQKVNKFYNKGKSNEIHVLNDINIDLGAVGFVAILGPSGSGKTTLLNALCGLDKIDSGAIEIENQTITKYRHHTWDDLRNQYFGYIFQNYHLFGDQTVFQNVAFSLEMLGIKDKEAIKTRVLQALAIVKMDKYKNRLAKNLSGGEQQRVAIARAIVKDPEYVIADEPTGNLDRKNTLIIMNILKEIAKTRLVVMVTHERPLAFMFASRIITISDGRIVEDKVNEGSGDSNYVDDRVVYLGDLEHRVNVRDGSVNLEFLSDSPIDIDSLNVRLKLVVRGKNIYLKPEIDSDYKLEVISEGSLFSFQEGTRPAETFDMKEAMDKWQPLAVPNKKRYNLSLWRFYKQGFQEIFNISRMKKIILFGFVISSFLLTLALGLYQQATTIDESEFVNFNRDIVNIDQNKNYNEAFEDFQSYFNLAGVYAVGKNSAPPILMTVEGYYQTFLSGESMTYLPSVLSYDPSIQLKPNNGEVVLSRGIVKKLLNRDNFYNDTFFSSDKMIKNQKMTIGDREYKIKGIEETDKLAIYLSKSDYFIANVVQYKTTNNLYLPVYLLGDVTTTVSELKHQEILVSENFPVNLNVGDQFSGYTVKGKFSVDGDATIVGIVFSEEDMTNLIFETNYAIGTSYYLYSRNPIKTAKQIREMGGMATSLYEEAYLNYRTNKLSAFRILLIFVAIMLIAPLLMLYFVMRSNMISRIKEIGIYRALGLRRYNIYKMHLGEILAITSLFSFSGYILALFVMFQSNRKILIPVFKLNFPVLFGSLAIIVIINVLVGLLPVFRLMRNTPQAILSKYDI